MMYTPEQMHSLQLAELEPWQRQCAADYLIHGYQRLGSIAGERVHFLHGNGFSALTLAAVASQLPQDWNLWLTNVPGHGGSPQPNHRMPDWQEMADSIAEVIEEQSMFAQYGPIIGVGHSLGGVLTLLAAANHPHLFTRIILLDPPLFVPSIIAGQHFLRATGLWKQTPLVKAVNNRTFSWTTPSDMRRELRAKNLYKNWHNQALSDFISSATTRSASGDLQLACQPRWEASIFGSYPRKLWKQIREVTVPVDIITADNSYRFIRPAARKASRINACVTQHHFGDSHCFPMEQPKQTAEFIQQLIHQANEDSDNVCCARPAMY